jgi:soluble lytic murein transglycosylase-like protein
MNKLRKFQIVKILVIVCTMTPHTAKADIYVNLSQEDEINISNTQLEPQYTLKFEEPIPQLEITQAELKTKTTDSKNTNHLPYNNEVMLAASATEIEPALIHAVMAVESKHIAKACSKKGAYGLMQLMPATARRFHVNDKNDPKQNIMAGSKYLRELLTMFNGDIKLSLAAYNAGPAAVQKYHNKIPPYKETMHYVPSVLKYYRQYS